MEIDFRKRLYFWFLSFENYKDSFNTHKKLTGFIFVPYFLSDNISFILLSIFYYLIKLILPIFQLIYFIFSQTAKFFSQICKSRKKLKRTNSGFVDENMNKIQLFLDLDNTLIYSSINKLDNFKNFAKLNNSFYVYKRPHLDNFLNTASHICDITIYTASVREYADLVIDYIDKNKLISKRLYRTDCININKSWFKDVSRYCNGHEDKNIIVIDDIPNCHLSMRNNIIGIKSWSGDDIYDDSLHKLRNILQTYRGTKDISDIISTSIVCDI